MNKIYRLIWNEITCTWVAVSEITRGRGKRASGVVGGIGAVGWMSEALSNVFNVHTAEGAALFRPTLLALALFSLNTAYAAPAPTQLPTGGTLAAGAATIAQNGSTLNINQTSNRAALNWQTFNVGSSATVNFNQPSTNSVTLNRINDSNPSQIFGQINANGQVFLTNPNGLYFAPSASANVGGLVATTHSISDADFMAGNTTFTRNGATGSVINDGNLTASLGGYIALLAPEVQNNGIIIAQLGTVALAAGENYTLQFDNNNTLADITVTPATIAALVQNGNAVHAPGGLIILSAQAANSLQGGVVNNSGSLEASGFVNNGGVIRLSASQTINQSGSVQAGSQLNISANQVLLNTGTLKAGDGVIGGQITATVNNLVDAGTWDASGTTAAGKINITASGTAEQTVAGLMTAAGASGGNISLAAGTSAYLSGQFNANGTSGNGGTISLTAPALTLAGAQLHADGKGLTNSSGGTIRLGGGWQGNDSDLANATTTYVDSQTTVTANAAQNGNGGTVVVWSESNTAFAGAIEARGGAQSGNGGQVEISSHDTLAFAGSVITAAPNGSNGNLLLDPKNINIETTVSNGFTQTLLNGYPVANASYGQSVTELPINGNLVVAAPYDTTGGTNAGKVQLYSSTGTLLSTLLGSSYSEVGNAGITALPNGNFVVASSVWGQTGNGYGYGAVTWVSGTSGLSGQISASNSLVGSTETSTYADYVGLDGITVLTGSSNYLVLSKNWGATSSGSYQGKGALTWMNGSNGQLVGGATGGAVSASNSIIGTGPSSSSLAWNPTIKLLPNGNYLFISGGWGNNSYGLVVWGDGTNGTAGTVSSSNSFIGSQSNEYVGLGAVLSNGDYVVSSTNWNSGQGFATWMNGATGKSLDGSYNPTISSSNSLIGGGTYYTGVQVIALQNGNYVVTSQGSGGFATWVNGSAGTGAGTFGTVSASNSLSGTGNSPTYALTNGNYVVVNPAGTGSATWVNGSDGYTMGSSSVSATPSVSNSIVGSTTGDFGGYSVTPLSNGNFVLGNYAWHNGGTANAGAVTWGNGSTGTAETISSSNSLVGSNASDYVGMNVKALTGNGNYVVYETNWNSSRGAVTWGNGAGGTTGTVSSSNSLVGSLTTDNVGYSAIVLSNGNYVVGSPSWGLNSSTTSVGAATWFNGSNGQMATGSIGGTVSSSNSLLGSSASDKVGQSLTALTGGNYVVDSSNWGGTKGAVTWGNGATGTVGTVSSSNSLVGSNSGDYVGGYNGGGNVTLLSDGNYLVSSTNASTSSLSLNGAVTWFNSASGQMIDGTTSGTLSTSNSYVGTVANEQFGQTSYLWKLSVGSNAGGFLIGVPNLTVSGQTGAGQVYEYSPASVTFSGTLAYTTSTGANNTLSATQVDNLLNAGTNVTLQASNDLTVDAAISGTHTGTSLTLDAGRSILLNANLSTTNGNVNLTANDTAADGVVNTDRASGAAVITMASGASISAGSGAVNIQLLNGAGNTNSTSGEITLRSINASTISAVNSGGTGGVTLASGALTASGTGHDIVLAGQDFINQASASALSAGSGNWLVYSASPSATTKDGETSNFRHYSGTYTNYAPGSVTESGNGFIYTSAAGTLSVATTLSSGSATSVYGSTPTAVYGTTITGFADSEDNASNIGLGGTATFSGAPTSSSNAGGYTVSYLSGLTDTKGYAFAAGTTLSATVSQAPLTISGLSSTSRTYNGTTSDTLSGTASLLGLIGGQTFVLNNTTVGTLASANAGSEAVATAITLGTASGGASASNYTLTQPTLANANIAKAPLTVSTSNVTKTYDGGTTASGTDMVVSGTLYTNASHGSAADVLTGGSFAFADKNVGTGNKTVTVSGITVNDGNSGNNYIVTEANNTTSTITPRALTITAATSTKTYDGTTVSTATPTTNGAIQSGDSLTSLIETFDSKNASTTNGRTLSVSSYTLNDGNNGNNYTVTLATATGTINPLTLTVNGSTTGVVKTYDGTTSMPVGVAGYNALGGTISGDSVQLTGSPVYSSANAGSPSVVVGSTALTGADAGNYTLSWVNGTGTINKAPLTMTANNAAAVLTASDPTFTASYSGFVDGQTAATAAGLSTSFTRTAGVAAGNYTITPSGTATNYTITPVTGVFTIIPANELLISVTNASSTYGNTLPSFVAGSAEYYSSTGSAIRAVTLTPTGSGNYTYTDGLGTTGSFSLSTAATSTSGVGNYAVTVSNFAKTGTNFTTEVTQNGVLAISQRAATLSANPYSMVYDGSTAITGATASLSNLVGNDAVSLTGSGSFNGTANVGTSLSYTLNSLQLTGLQAANYYLSSPTLTASNGAITARPLSWTVNNASSTYGTTATPGTATLINTIAGDVLTDTVTVYNTGTATVVTPATRTAAGTYDEKVTAIGGASAGNYTLASTGNTTGTLTVAPKAITLTADAISKTYD